MQHEFPHAVIREAYDLSQHRCQCTDPDCPHHSDDEGRCRQILRWPAQDDTARDGWRAVHIDPTGPGAIGNCQILCSQCYAHAMATSRSTEPVVERRRPALVAATATN